MYSLAQKQRNSANPSKNATLKAQYLGDALTNFHSVKSILILMKSRLHIFEK
jgi:hypothetical protein